MSLWSHLLKTRLALAVGLFFVGLEYLWTVRGPMAVQYNQNAESELRRLNKSL